MSLKANGGNQQRNITTCLKSKIHVGSDNDSPISSPNLI